MTDSEILARWQGWENHPQLGFVLKLSEVGFTANLPDYPNDDAAAMSLLDTLVEKGYTPIVEYARYIMPNCWICTVCHHSGKEKDMLRIKGNTRREAVVAACLKLIDRENTDDPTR